MLVWEKGKRCKGTGVEVEQELCDEVGDIKGMDARCGMLESGVSWCGRRESYVRRQVWK